MTRFYRRKLTFTGGVQYDKLRHANPVVEGDGIAAFDRSVGVWEATTNLQRNGGVETNLTFWNVFGVGVTITRISTQKKFGSWSAEMVTPGSVGDERTEVDGVANGQAWAAATKVMGSVWLRGSGGAVDVMTRIVNTDASTTDSARTTITLSSTWTRVTALATVAGGKTGDRAIVLVLTGGTPHVVTCDMDGVQVEAQPIATPYVETDGATATRAGARASAPLLSVWKQPVQGWVAVRVRPRWAATDDIYSGNFVRVVELGPDDVSNVLLVFDPSIDSWSVGRTKESVTQWASVASTHVSGDTVTLVAAWETASTVRISVNGAAFVSATTAPEPTAWSDVVFGIGNHPTLVTVAADGEFLWGLAGGGVLTSDIAEAIHNIGNGKPTFYDVPDLAELAWLWTCEDEYCWMRRLD